MFSTIEFTIAFMLWFLHFVAANAVLPSQLKQRGSIRTKLSGVGLVFLVNSITSSCGDGGTVVVAVVVVVVVADVVGFAGARSVVGVGDDEGLTVTDVIAIDSSLDVAVTENPSCCADVVVFSFSPAPPSIEPT